VIVDAVIRGQTADDVARRLAGTRRAGFADGALAITRRNAETVARTAINHVSNASRDLFFDENADILVGKRWTATLDGRTSPICRANDGRIKPVPGQEKLAAKHGGLLPQSAVLPAHLNERSVWIGILDAVGVVGERPFVVDKRRPERRLADFRKEARRTGRPIKEIRSRWADENVGTVPAKTTWGEFLGKQSRATQDDWLGPTRAKIWRAGGDLPKFIDTEGRLLSLSDLAKTRPGMFQAAGLKPADFR
jgi:hypothetical protein